MKTLQITSSTTADIDAIFDLYDQGTAHQAKVATKVWKGFERSLVEEEIKEKRQWKILMEDEIVCVFATTFSDPLIWGEKNEEPAIYIHRIATSAAHRGNSFVKHIVEWAKQYAIGHGKQFVRLDTGSGNEKLNNYYVSCGFTYLGVNLLSNTEGLPEHYKTGSFSIFEIKL
jgi:ribosomal protein S18 acetylase RimI-like enzyme